MPISIIADHKIPGLDWLGSRVDLHLLPSEAISSALHSAAFSDVQGIIVRSIQRVDRALLEKTNIKWVATPTSGIDHMDKAYLDSRGILLFSAPGCNASGVADYMLWMVAYLEKHNMLSVDINAFPQKTVGIIGAGHVGKQVQKMLTLLEFNVFMYDPPQGLKTDLNAIAACDLICVHPSLSYDGLYPSYHLLSSEWFQIMNEKAILINASRGAVIDTDVLLKYAQTHPTFHYGLDVFEREPLVIKSVIERSFISTPHIAGHTIESFYRASHKIVGDIAQWMGISTLGLTESLESLESMESIIPIDATACLHWYDVILALYPFQSPDLLTSANFYAQRDKYRMRHDFSRIPIKISYALPELDRLLLENLSLHLENNHVE